MPILAEIAMLLGLILLNGFFALAELAIVSARAARLRHLADAGNRRARTALALAEDPALFLSSVQVGITLVGIVAGAFGGAALAKPLAGVLADALGLTPSASLTLGFVLVVGGITYFTVIIGELVPKRVALQNPERWALRVAPTMRLVALAMSPLVALLSGSSNLVVRLLRLPAARPLVTDEEVSLLLEEGIAGGVFERAEKEIVDRLFRLSDRRINAVMTPGADVAWLEADAPREAIVDALLAHPYTTFPVCERDLDHVVGVVDSGLIVERLLRGEPVTLRELMRPPLVLFEGLRALPAIERLRQSGAHLAILINEYGGTEGIVTFYDIFASLVGELPSVEAADVVRRPDGSLLVDGFLPVDDLKALLAAEMLPQEEDGYQTLAGLLLTNLGRIPRAGDRFTWDGFRFEVVDMDGTRVDRVLIERVEPPEET